MRHATLPAQERETDVLEGGACIHPPRRFRDGEQRTARLQGGDTRRRTGHARSRDGTRRSQVRISEGL